MKLKTKLPLYTSVTVLISIILVSTYFIVSYKQKITDDIETYRYEETEQIKQTVKDIVNLSYDMLAVSYSNSKNADFLRQLYQSRKVDPNDVNNKITTDDILKITLENLRALRFGTDGYIWINEIEPPYKVVMHPIKPELEGKGQIFYIGEESKRNVYEAFAEICNQYNEGYLEYDFYKPGEAEIMHKISYIKLFKEKGWVIGTGVYVDNIDKMVATKKAELSKQINRIILITLIISIFLMSVASAILYYLGNSITGAIFKIKEQLTEMAKGVQVEKLEFKRADEIGEIKESVDSLIDGINQYTKFAQEIGKGNLEAEFTALGEDDNLGNSLIEMRYSLQVAHKEEERRKDENAKRNWVSEGLGKFSDILRRNVEDVKELSYHIVRNMVEYLHSNQSALFVYNDDDKENVYLELVAAIAYDRRKYFTKKIKIGDGIVGMVALEKETVYLTNIPQNYMEITSGLGSSNPTVLLVVPLKIEDKIFGVIEIASFNTFEPHEIEFVEKISESIAATINNVKITEQTKYLLEQFRQQEDLKAEQEKEMRKNMRELRRLRELHNAETVKETDEYLNF